MELEVPALVSRRDQVGCWINAPNAVILNIKFLTEGGVVAIWSNRI